MKKAKPLLYDTVIINRVKLYLEENVDKTYLDVGEMSKQLMDRYAEYSRRKFVPFRKLVEQAYHIVSKSYGLESQPSSGGDESDASGLELMENIPSNNLMSNMMNTLYNKPKNPQSKQQTEAIDISSDESGDERNTINGKNIVKVRDGKPKATEVENADNTRSGGQTQKRHDFVLQEGHPAKKLKTDGGKTVQQIFREKQTTNRIVNFNPNSNDSSGFATAGGGGGFPTSSPQRPRRYKKEVKLKKSHESFQDIGGMERTLKELCEILINIKTPDIYYELGLMPPRGILLHGPPGCGKTLLAHAIAGQLAMPLIEIPATELIAGVSGESEERIRDIFEQAAACHPCVLFIDEIDAISGNRSYAQKDMERRIVSQLISSLDNLKLSDGGQSVLVIGATTRPDILDPSLRRVGRFDHEIAIGIPSRKDRKDILTILCDGLSMEQKMDYDKIAELTPGYVGADLLALVSRAATIAVKRKYLEQLRDWQAKAQSNITIVDLDDDETESTSATKALSKEEQQSSVSEDKGQIADTEVREKEEEEKATTQEKSAESAATEKKKPENAESMDTDEPNNAESTKSENSTSEKIEESAEQKTKEAAAVRNHEPTLFELLNWLDNPPEDSMVGDFCITFEDLCAAVKVVQPSAKREGFITVPDITWDDIGSLQDIREELKLAVLAPVKFPEKLQRLGLTAPSGVLLCGPPGCGKTLLAKAIANEAGINFISVKGPELMNMYVGESERAVRACFQRARNSTPCVIFFDEFDSLCPKRSDGNESGSGTRIVNQLLTEMDGVEDRKGVYILAATNRPDIIDPAILRPGRLDTILYVGLPEANDRVEILKANTKNGTRPVLADDVDLQDLANKTDGYTGADLAGLVKQAAMLALRESINNPNSKLEDLCVNKKHFAEAIQLLRPSVNAQDRKVYEKLRLKYAAPRDSLNTTIEA